MKKRDTLFFAAYLSPPPAEVGHGPWAHNANFITDEHYQTMIDCGFDSAIGLFENTVEHYTAGMRRAQANGMCYYVRDQFADGSIEGIIDDTAERAADLFARHGQAIADRFDRYMQFPAYRGILASDEPCAAKFANIAWMKEWFLERYPDKDFLVNLLPTYANPMQLSGDERAESFDYENDYVGAFLRTVRPEVLSYDNYALIWDEKKGENVLREDYLRNLEVFAGHSRRTGIPFYVFLLTIGHLYYRTMKTYADIAWQVYSALAYGATGAQTFTYWTLLSNGPVEKITTGLVDRDGGKTPAWYAMQEVIREVRAFERAFMDCRWEGVLPLNGGRSENANFRQLKSPLTSHAGLAGAAASGDSIVGAFRTGSGREAYLVCNFEDPVLNREQTVRLEFARARSVEIWQGGKKSCAELADGVAEIRLRAGEGVFIKTN